MKKILILLMCFYAGNTFAHLTAHTDVVNVSESGVFQLEIKTDTDINGKPDLSPLQDDFEIVGQGTSQSVQVIGNTRTSQQSLILNLIPKKTGILTIPEITWGTEKTKALQIEVKPDSDTVQIQKEDALIIEAAPLSTTTYQGAGLLYRVQLFERIGLVDGDFYPPYLQDAEIIPLGDYTLSQEKKNDVLYQVRTQNYIIFPQNAGNNLTIEPAKFQGYYRIKQGSEQLRLMGFTDSFVYQPRMVRKDVSLRAKPVQITVLPQPENTKNYWWLPAENVSLSENWNEPEKIKVGEPITRQIKLQAVGVLGRMLPDLTISNTDDYKVYPETAQKNQTYEEDIGLIGQETQTFAFIPLRSGQITLPAVSVNWFDISEGKMKTATLPSKTFTVEENPMYASALVKKTPEVEQKQPEQPVLQTPQNQFAHENNILYFVGGLSFGLIFAVIGIILFHRKHKHKKKLPELYPNEK